MSENNMDIHRDKARTRRFLTDLIREHPGIDRVDTLAILRSRLLPKGASPLLQSVIESLFNGNFAMAEREAHPEKAAEAKRTREQQRRVIHDKVRAETDEALDKLSAGVRAEGRKLLLDWIEQAQHAEKRADAEVESYKQGSISRSELAKRLEDIAAGDPALLSALKGHCGWAWHDDTVEWVAGATPTPQPGFVEMTEDDEVWIRGGRHGERANADG